MADEARGRGGFTPERVAALFRDEITAAALSSWPLLEEYRLVAPLGRGAMGRVYLAHDTLLDRSVAIKFLDGLQAHADARERFLLEARAIARLSHPNVVGIYRIGEVHGHPYLVSEFVRGQSLDRLRLPLPWPRALAIALDLCRGLSAAHRRGVLHRDIKRANAILTEEQTVKLLDFGLAKLVDAALPPSLRTSFIGTATTLRPGQVSSPVAGQPHSPATGPATASATAPVTVQATASVPGSLAGSVSGYEATDPRAAPPVSAAGLLTQTGALLGTPIYMAPEVWNSEPATERSDLYSLGVVLYELCSARPPHYVEDLMGLGYAVTHTDAAPLASLAPTVDARFAAAIDRCLRRAPAERPRSVDELYQALLRIPAEGQPATPASARPRGNPYRGLYPFEADDQALFFGRAQDIRILLERLRAEPLLLVAGDSGVGKSSLCRAGLLSRIRGGELGEGRRFRILTMFPGKRPLSTLAEVLSPILERPRSALMQELASQPADCVRRMHRLQGERQGLLLFVDQLEELITQSEAGEAAAFAEVLGQLLARGPGVRVLCTARGDFLTRLAELPGLGRDLQRTLYILRSLDRDGLQAAIVGPAEVGGVQFESQALIEELVETTLQTEGGLPLLQFALAELWQARDQQTQCITAAALRSLGGVAGALSRHADRVVDGLLPAGRLAARHLLTRLVSRDGLRLRRSADEIQSGQPAEASVLETLVSERLLLVREQDGVPVYAIAHEALVSGWARLREWLSNAAEQRAVHERLSSAAAEWQRLGKASDALWNERQLQELDGSGLDRAQLSQRESEFVKQARRQVSRKRRGRLAVWVLLGNFVALSAASAYLWILKEQNARLAAGERGRKEIAERMEIASQALSLAQLPGREVPALLQSLSVVATSERRGERPPPAALEALSAAVGAGLRSLPLRAHRLPVQSASFSPDGRQVLTTSDDESARLWQVADGTQRWVAEGVGQWGTFLPDGQRLLVNHRTGRTHVLSRQTGAVLQVLTHQGSLGVTRFSPDGRLAATRLISAQDQEGTVLWQPTDGRTLAVLPGALEPRSPTVFSPDGRLLLTGDQERTISLWDTGSGARVATLTTPEPVMPPAWLHAFFSSDGQKIVGSNAYDVWIWEAKSQRRLVTIKGAQDPQSFGLLLSPDGSTLISSAAGAALRLFSALGGGLLARPAGHAGQILSGRLSTDASLLLTTSADKTARLWRLSSGQALDVLSGHTEAVLSGEFSPDGEKVVTASRDNDARIFTLGGGQQLLRLGGHRDMVLYATYSRDGRYIATASADRSAAVFDATSGKMLASISLPDSVQVVAFSLDGEYLATGTGYLDRTIRIWDWHQRRVVVELSGHSGGITALAFSPDARLLGSTSSDGTLRLWDFRAGQPVWISPPQPVGLCQLAFAPRGERIATSEVSGSVRLWDVATGQVLYSLTDSPGRAAAAAFSPDGSRLAVAGRRTRILDSGSGRELVELLGHLDATVTASFSPDGRQVVTQGSDQTVRVWDAAGGPPLYILRTEVAAGAQFSPDGQRLLVTHPNDHSAKLYPATTAALLQRACSLLRSQPEWPQVAALCAR